MTGIEKAQELEEKGLTRRAEHQYRELLKTASNGNEFSLILKNINRLARINRRSVPNYNYVEYRAGVTIND